jgi:ABC-type transport system substrate-binding protein
MKAGNIAVETANRANFGKIEPYTSPWKDPRVRIGMHKIMNWDAYQETESNVAAFRAAGVEPVLGYTTHVPFDAAYFLDPRKNELGQESQNYMYDPQAARQLISAAGYPDGFELDYWYRDSDIATVHQDAFRQSGLVKPISHSLTAQVYADMIVARAEFKGMQYPSTSSGSDVDYLLFRNYHSNGPPNPWTQTKDLDDIITKQRQEADPARRAEYIKEFQRMVAKNFQLIPGSHRFSGWSFEWPWLHNVNWGPTNRSWSDHYLNWLDPTMPRRNG